MPKKKPVGEEKRTLYRIPNRQQNYYRCVIQTHEGEIRGNILDLTSTGLAIEVTNPDFFANNLEIKQIEVFYAKKRLTVIDSFKVIRRDGERKFLAIEITQGDDHRGLRQTQRLQLNTRFLPQITGADPLKPYEKLIFIVHEITKDGLQMSTSFRNKHILSGMRFKGFEISIPGESSYPIHFEIRHIKPIDGTLMIGAKLFDTDHDLQEAFARLAFFAAIPKAANPMEAIEIIRKSNFSLRKIADAVRVDVVHTENEFLQALKVRLESYKAVSKVAGDASVEDMQDEFDEHSITYIGKINDKVIATFRFTESDGAKNPFPFEKYYDYEKYISLDRKDVYEVSKLGILPGFLGTDLIQAIFRAVSLDVARSKKSMAILSTNSLRKMYLELGARILSEEAPHPKLPNEKLNLLLLDVKDYLFGGTIKEKSWHKVVKGNLDLLFRFGFLEKSMLKANFKDLKRLLRKK